ncbi:MAG: hypothetical protein IPK50_16580 [Fibrobacterota bacterium]|nr:MAG: hypothetical protein IPK50_16580 [Fibrobacterota bacterium]
MSSVKLHQEGSNNYQAGRDLIVPIPDDEISEPEFRNIIQKFINSVTSAKSDDFAIIDIDKKNELNNLSPKAFEHIRNLSIVGYDQIEALLKNPNNETLREEYESLVASMQQQYVISNLCGNIERFFRKAYEFFVSHCSSIKERNWGIQLVYFMYLRCDIGLK